MRRHFYWRQLRDMKGSAIVEAMSPLGLTFYARICGWTLARAHARSGDPVAMAAYLGGSDAFDNSITDFSQRYADQNERDYQEFVNAVRSGRLEAAEGVKRSDRACLRPTGGRRRAGGGDPRELTLVQTDRGAAQDYYRSVVHGVYLCAPHACGPLCGCVTCTAAGHAQTSVVCMSHTTPSRGCGRRRVALIPSGR